MQETRTGGRTWGKWEEWRWKWRRGWEWCRGWSRSRWWKWERRWRRWWWERERQAKVEREEGEEGKEAVGVSQ
jgi:hypothetical protein